MRKSQKIAIHAKYKKLASFNYFKLLLLLSKCRHEKSETFWHLYDLKNLKNSLVFSNLIRNYTKAN